MRVLLANPRGFCAGVNMAVEVVQQVLELKGPPVYVFHEIVHNRHVVEDFKRRGVTFVDDVKEVPDGCVIVYSAHGISPQVRQDAKARRLLEVDATCPLVTKVHMEVLRYARDGYTILFIGHRNHDEAVGTVGEAPGSIIVVESPEEVARARVPDPEKVAFVTQTTMSVSDAQRIIDAVKQRFPNVKYPPKEDICYATTNRQNAVSELASQVDLVLVVGSQNSSNSKRLVEVGHNYGVQSFLVNDWSDVDRAWLDGARNVGVTAGASAPEYLVDRIVSALREEGYGQLEEVEMIEEDVRFSLPPELAGAASQLYSISR